MENRDGQLGVLPPTAWVAQRIAMEAFSMAIEFVRCIYDA